MAEEMICQNCGAKLDISMRKGSSNLVECEYCHFNNIIASLDCSSQEASPSSWSGDIRFFIPSETTEQFENRCQQLFDDDPLLPDDIFREIDFADVRKVFLPVWVVPFKASGGISWKSGSDNRYANVNTNATYYSLAAKSSAVPADIADSLFAFEPPIRAGYDEKEFSAFIAAPPEGYEIETSRSPLNRRMREFEKSLTDNLKKTFVTDANATDVNCNVNVVIDKYFDENVDVIFVPFHIVGFKYKSREYHIACDALTGSCFLYHLPVDRKRKTLLDNTFPNWAIITMGLIVIGPPALWLFGPLSFGTLLKLLIPAIIALGVVTTVAMKQSEATRNQIISQARQARKQ